MTIKLSREEIVEMQTRFALESDKPNYYGMYKYIFNTYGMEMDALILSRTDLVYS